MSRHQKTLEKLKSKPPASDIKWSELKSLLESLGYSLHKSGGGSGRKFYNKEKQALICCHQPHPSPCVDKGCVVDIAEHLQEHGFLEDNI